MRRGRSGHVCPRCGQSGQIVHTDGSKADFAPPEGSAWSGVVAVLAGIVIVAGLVGAWLWRAGPGAGWLQVGEAAASADPVAPDWRPDGRAAFAPPLADGVLGIFGTAGADRPLAVAALSNGAFVTVAETAGMGSEPAYWIVKFDSADTLTVFPLTVAGRLTGASIAPAGPDGFLLALTGPGGLQLAAYGPEEAPRWQRELATSDPAGPAAIALYSDGVAYLAAPAAAAGRAGISAYDGAGDLLWQRSFDLPAGARMEATLLPEGGVLAAFETLPGEAETEISLVWFSANGDIWRSVGGVRPGGRLSGVSAAGSEARLLTASGSPALVTFRPGDEARRQLLPQAALHDVLLLGETAAGAPLVAASFQLAGIQTDLVVMEETLAGWASERARLPSEAEVIHMVAAGETLILAGRTGAAESADVFILAVPRARPAGAGAMNEGEAGGEAQVVEAPVPEPVPESLDVPDAQTLPGRETLASTAEGEPVAARRGPLTCRFVCRDGDLVFPLTKTVGPDEAQAEGGTGGLHGAACRQIGADAAPTAPECTG